MKHSSSNSVTGERMQETAQRAALRAEQAIRHTRRAADQALDRLEHRVEDLRHSVPDQLGEQVRHAEALTRSSLERARALSARLHERMGHAGERSSERIREAPFKSVLLAAASGAALALLAGWANRSRHH